MCCVARAVGGHEREARADTVEPYLRILHVPIAARRPCPRRHRFHGDQRLRREPLGIGIVDTHDAPSRPARREELRLVGQVPIHRLVEVEVVPLEVGEHCHREVDTRDAIEGRRVRAHLGHRRGDSLVEHAR